MGKSFKDIKQSNYTYLEILRIKAFDLGKDVKTISDIVLDNPKFRTWTGSTGNKHHHGAGGLIEHTYEVITLCLKNNKTFDYQIDPKSLFLAALYHDVGKMWDYGTEIVDNQLIWINLPARRNIHHISRSAIEWSKAVDKTGLFKKEHDEILHAILAHHCERAWGSPVAPNSKLAWMLHLCDNMSARMNDCEKFDIVKK